MANYELITFIFVAVSLFKLINLKFLKIQSDIAMLFLALIVTSITFTLKFLGINIIDNVKDYLVNIHFGDTVLNFALGILLFAGTISLNVKHFYASRKRIVIYTVIGVIISTLFVGTALFVFILILFPGFNLTYMECLLFGSIMSPTDPISALSILNSLGIRKSLLVQMEGESLFNDGLGLVVFMTIKTLIDGDGGEIGDLIVSSFHIILQQITGGIILGFVAAYTMIKFCQKIINDETTLIILSFAMVMATYKIGIELETSSALATVVMGMYFGNFLRKEEKNSVSLQHLEIVWQSVGNLFNAVLFMLVGVMVVYILDDLSFSLVMICILAIIFCLAGRFIGLSISEAFLRHYVVSQIRRVTILTWGGLHGSISIAIALALVNSEYHFGKLFLAMTFCVVVFSVVVQGLTLKPLTRRFYDKDEE